MKQEDVKFRVERFCDDCEYYVIYYKSRNFFGFSKWKRITEASRFSTYHFRLDSPLLLSFDQAVRKATEFKNNPELLKAHNLKQIEKFKQYEKELKEHQSKYNKSVII
jgi:hypothetical protein